MKIRFLIPFLGLSVICLFACRPSPSQPGTACISVDQGPDSGAQPIARRPATYLLSFSGPAFMNDVAMSGSTVWVALPAGIWTVQARAVDQAGHTIASGSSSRVEIAKGKTSPVSIALFPAAVELSASSPGGIRPSGKTASLD